MSTTRVTTSVSVVVRLCFKIALYVGLIAIAPWMVRVVYEFWGGGVEAVTAGLVGVLFVEAVRTVVRTLRAILGARITGHRGTAAPVDYYLAGGTFRYSADETTGGAA